MSPPTMSDGYFEPHHHHASSQAFPSHPPSHISSHRPRRSFDLSSVKQDNEVAPFYFTPPSPSGTSSSRARSHRIRRSSMHSACTSPTASLQEHAKRAEKMGAFMNGCLTHTLPVKRWDGASRQSIEWDSLRQDPELWHRNGDCLVYLYTQGCSRRGPSFRISSSMLLQARCQPLLDRFGVTTTRQNIELHIAPPENCDAETALRYRLATRNFFAWVFRRSLVGYHLSDAIIELLQFMNEWRSFDSTNVADLLDYLDEEGYLNMQNHPDHALAMLYVSEHLQLKSLYIDAFAHCTGMSNYLPQSPEYPHTSSVSRKLIRRARTDYDLRLIRVSTMLHEFLLDELSEANLGLTPAARTHLDQFRDFLIDHYCHRFGQYPPPSVDIRASIYSKNVFMTMREDFEVLYESLVDKSFTLAKSIPPLAQGGICVVQSVHSFDLRYRFPALTHPLPLLPEIHGSNSTTSNSSSGLIKRGWLSRGDRTRQDERRAYCEALEQAMNSSTTMKGSDSSTTVNSQMSTRSKKMERNLLVQAYRDLEKQLVFQMNSPTASTNNAAAVPLSLTANRKERLSIVDARKIRWILIYAVYQTLRSVTEPPAEVQEAENADYLVAVSTRDLPPWREYAARPAKKIAPGRGRDISHNNPQHEQVQYPFLQTMGLPQRRKTDPAFYQLLQSQNLAASSAEITPIARSFSCGTQPELDYLVTAQKQKAELQQKQMQDFHDGRQSKQGGNHSRRGSLSRVPFLRSSGSTSSSTSSSSSATTPSLAASNSSVRTPSSVSSSSSAAMMPSPSSYTGLDAEDSLASARRSKSLSRSFTQKDIFRRSMSIFRNPSKSSPALVHLAPSHVVEDERLRLEFEEARAGTRTTVLSMTGDCGEATDNCYESTLTSVASVLPCAKLSSSTPPPIPELSMARRASLPSLRAAKNRASTLGLSVQTNTSAVVASGPRSAGIITTSNRNSWRSMPGSAMPTTVVSTTFSSEYVRPSSQDGGFHTNSASTMHTSTITTAPSPQEIDELGIEDDVGNGQSTFSSSSVNVTNTCGGISLDDESMSYYRQFWQPSEIGFQATGGMTETSY